MGAVLFFLLLAFGVIGLAIYFVPTIVGVVRGVPNRGALLAVNAFLGWTFVGWVGAMVMALRPPASPPSGPLEATVLSDVPVYETRALEAAARELPEDPFASM